MKLTLEKGPILKNLRCEMTRLDWEINVENLAMRVAENYGSDVVASVFARYDATCFDDLNPCYYADVFGDLMLIDADG